MGRSRKSPLRVARGAVAVAIAFGAGLASVALGQDAGAGRKPLAGTTAGPATSPAAARPAAAAVIAELKIREDREISSNDGAEGARIGRPPETQIEFLVTGGGVRGATRAVDARIDEAVDDLGNDLLVRSDRPDPVLRKLQDLRRALRGGQNGGGGGAAEPNREQPRIRLWPSGEGDAIEVKFDLAQTARKATTIKRLRGRFSLAVGGARQTVTIDKPVTRAGKDLDDPALAATGARIAILPEAGRAGRGPPMLHLRINGPGEALARLRVVSADGRVVGDGLIDADKGDGERTDMTILNRPVDDTMRVEIDLVAGQKLLPFEFDLKDVPLP